MKYLFRLLAVLFFMLMSLPISAAEEKGDLLDRFENALLDVMANFETAHDATGISSDTRKLYDKSLLELQTTAAALQNAVDSLGLGSDINPNQHVKQVNDAFRSLSDKSLINLTTTADKNTGNSKNKQSDDKLRSMGSLFGADSIANRTGLAFRNLNNDLQCLRELDFHSENGRYIIAPQKRQLLPYLEFQRNYLYFRMHYPNMIDLCKNRTWTNDMEKRLLRMRSLAATIQPVFRAYCPDEAAKINLASEADRLVKVCQAISRESSRISQKDTLGMNTILDTQTQTTATLQLKSPTLNKAQKDRQQQQQTTAAVENTSAEYEKNAERAFSNLLVYFESMDKIDWDVYAFSKTKSKKVPEADTAAAQKKDSKTASSTKKTAKNPDVVEVTGDEELQWK